MLDYLVTGITHTLTHSSNIALARLKKREKELIEAGYIAPPPPRKERATGSSARDSTNSIVSVSRATSASSPGELIDEGDDAARQRLENIGVIVGGNLAERYDLVSIELLAQLPLPDFEDWSVIARHVFPNL